jgi:hypothetical protein
MKWVDTFLDTLSVGVILLLCMTSLKSMDQINNNK